MTTTTYSDKMPFIKSTVQLWLKHPETKCYVLDENNKEIRILVVVPK